MSTVCSREATLVKLVHYLGVCRKGQEYYLRQVPMGKLKFSSHASKICFYHSSFAEHSHLLVCDNAFWASTCQWFRGLYCL